MTAPDFYRELKKLGYHNQKADTFCPTPLLPDILEADRFEIFKLWFKFGLGQMNWRIALNNAQSLVTTGHLKYAFQFITDNQYRSAFHDLRKEVVKQKEFQSSKTKSK